MRFAGEEAAGQNDDIIVFEQAAGEIGGQFNMARRIPGKEEFSETLRYFRRRIEVTGALRKGVYAKDVILAIIGKLGVKGGTGTSNFFSVVKLASLAGFAARTAPLAEDRGASDAGAVADTRAIVIDTLECSGNGRALLSERAAGNPWTIGGVGNAVWGGVWLWRKGR